MKKRLAVLGGNGTAHPISKICAMLLIGIGLSLGAVSVHADGNRSGGNNSGSNSGNNGGGNDHGGNNNGPSPTPKPPKPSPTPKPGTCAVCDHEGGKNKDKQIACKDVDEYLREHPTSTRGPCTPTPVTNR
jgi:hypothetical protein